MKKEIKKHNSKKGTYIAIVIGIIIIGVAITYFYSIEQAKIRGLSFGKNLELIQLDLKILQDQYESSLRVWKEGSITKDQILQVSNDHLQKFKELIPRYDTLVPPKTFVPSVNLFKLSTEKQLESDKMLVEWIKSGDNSSLTRSDSLLQESFEYEMAALSSYHHAKAGTQP